MKKEYIKVEGQRLLSVIKDLIKEGTVRRIIIKDSQDKVVLNLPLNFVVVAALWTPLLAGFSAGLALFSDYEIEFHKKAQD